MSFWKHLIEKGEASITPIEVQQQMFDKVYAEYRKHYPEMSDAFFADFRQRCEVVRFNKGAEISGYEEANQHLIVAVKGLIVARDVKHERERVIWFMGGHDSSVMEESFFIRLRNSYQLVALETSDCIMLPYETEEMLSVRYQEFKPIVHKEVIKNVITQDDRHSWGHLPPINRYQKIYNENPHVISSLPDEEVAKHIGVDTDVVTQLRNLNEQIGWHSN